ncbi:DNA mismatch repair protein MutT [Caulobacter sp. CCUG 60055]|uniref:NUDIX domain-containing protein n=1 Tax=Caulobacter sp. CCUG 60055 TaxID=2100090 RepID=UPI001FA80A93|nr:NUDIX hydrolase [Caulobacter sp. CCUG 60055]MBQ1542149.1 NUDIX hydrolase [Caulobacteraceae bacterium]MCI3181773.1 DNA mismatch repair protein MutT [Caulobacter sp. CCUG 60055]
MSQKPNWLTSHGTPWRPGEARLVYENPWISVSEHQAVAPTGRPALYGVVRFKNLAIGVLPIHDDGTIVLVGQHRFAHGAYSWEIPEGGGPLGVDPLDTAKRELREEAGLTAAVWREAMRFDVSNSITDERGYGYIATGLAAVEAEPDETEALTLARVPFREALDQAGEGGLRDMITLAMLWRAYHMAREGELPRDLAKAMLG